MCNVTTRHNTARNFFSPAGEVTVSSPVNRPVFCHDDYDDCHKWTSKAFLYPVVYQSRGGVSLSVQMSCVCLSVYPCSVTSPPSVLSLLTVCTRLCFVCSLSKRSTLSVLSQFCFYSVGMYIQYTFCTQCVSNLISLTASLIRISSSNMESVCA